MGVAIEETWQQQRRLLDQLPPRTDGLVIRRLTANGPADKAGLKVFEVITRLDGQPVRLPDELLDAIRRQPADGTVTLDVLSPMTKKSRQVKLALGTLEEGWMAK